MQNLVQNNLVLNIKGWAELSRIPFHLVGIAPMIVGTIWARQSASIINWELASAAILAVILIMLATYYAGEYFDQKEDILSSKYWKSNFAGGSKTLQKGIINPSNVLKAANISAILAIILGIFIQFYFKTGYWTIPLGAFGLLAGYFYSVPPMRWVKRGIGELLIGLSYGYLPVFVSYYIQTNSFNPVLFIIASPIAISIFLVIFINEFPDNKADMETRKANLVVRLGINKSALIYIIGNILFIISIFYILLNNLVKKNMPLYFPVLLSMILALFIVLGFHKKPKTLEPVCALTILLNLSTNIILIISSFND
ncbi:MAG: prenyltransferase [Bacteroidetes bacterium]|nr:MAG: prenyltransferase [Bacteroidota bacterium]